MTDTNQDLSITKDSVVSFHYRLREGEGEVFETSEDGNPVLYLHGHNSMLKGLEEGLEGKKAGDSLTIEVPPEKGYGERKEGAQQRVSRKHVLTKGKLKPGMVVQINTKDGGQEALVLKVGLKNIDIDSNHPLAGKDLSFAVDVLEVRPASADELAHGHAHGAGGHEH